MLKMCPLFSVLLNSPSMISCVCDYLDQIVIYSLLLGAMVRTYWPLQPRSLCEMSAVVQHSIADQEIRDMYGSTHIQLHSVYLLRKDFIVLEVYIHLPKLPSL